MLYGIVQHTYLKMRTANGGHRRHLSCFPIGLVLVITAILLADIVTVSFNKFAQHHHVKVANLTNSVVQPRFAVTSSLWSDQARYTRHVSHCTHSAPRHHYSRLDFLCVPPSSSPPFISTLFSLFSILCYCTYYIYYTALYIYTVILYTVTHCGHPNVVDKSSMILTNPSIQIYIIK